MGRGPVWQEMEDEKYPYWAAPFKGGVLVKVATIVGVHVVFVPDMYITTVEGKKRLLRRNT